MADLLTRLRAVVAADNAIVQAKADRRAQDIKVYGEQFGRRTYSRSFWRGLYAARERAERELWGTHADDRVQAAREILVALNELDALPCPTCNGACTLDGLLPCGGCRGLGTRGGAHD